MLQIIRQAHPDLSIRMSRDRQPRLALNVPLRQIHIVFRTRIHNLNIRALVHARADIRSDDDEGVRVRLVPDALFRRVVVGGQVKFDGEGGGEEY